MNPQDAMLNEFVSEAKEHLANVSDDLIALDKVSDQARPYRIDRLFRAMHSVKGAAGFFGFVNITELSHLMETLLRDFREGNHSPNPMQVDCMLAGSDLILTLLDDVSHSNHVDISAVRNRLQGLLSESRQSSSEGNRTLAETRFEYRLQINLTAYCQQRGQPPLSLIRLLLSFGDLRDGSLEFPDQDLNLGLPGGPVIYHAILQSPMDLEHLRDALGLSKTEIVSMRTFAEPDAEEIIEAEVVPAVAKKTSPAAKGESQATDKATSTIRINVTLLDRLMNLAGELVLVRNQALLAFDPGEGGNRNSNTLGNGSKEVGRILQRLNSVTSELQDTVMRTRMQPIGNVFNKFPRIIRDLARGLNKEIDVVIEGQEVELDKSILEMLSDPLTHLIRNSCDHGIETRDERIRQKKPVTGIMTLTARHEGSQIHISIRDNGKGIDPEKVRRKAIQMGLKTEKELESISQRDLLGLILLPGFSTAEKVTDLSGRGVGMDVVRTNVEKLGGTLEIDSEPGEGTLFTLRLPLTVAIIPCLIVMVGEDRYAIPQKDLEELVIVFQNSTSGQIEYAFDQEVYRLRNRLLPLVRLNEVLARPVPFTAEVKARLTAQHKSTGKPKLDNSTRLDQQIRIVVVKAGRQRFGLIVDQVLTTEEIVVKPMHGVLKPLRCYSGATIMGDGRVALILELESIARHANLSFGKFQDQSHKAASEEKRESQTVLLFQYGPREQFALALQMIRRIVPISARPMAGSTQSALTIEQVGDREFVSLDGTITRVLRLDKMLPVSPASSPTLHISGHLILPRHVNKPVALLATQILDTVVLPTQLDSDSVNHDGVLGTAIVRGQLTMVLDIFRLADRLEGESKRASLELKMPTRKGPPRVLLVDDTQFFRLLVKSYLEDQGFEITTAINGAEGLELVQTQSFDLVVSDIEMPIMDGWNFARSVRELPKFKNLPMLALSTLSSEADQERALKCGFDRYEIKLDRDRFLKSVRSMLGLVENS